MATNTILLPVQNHFKLTTHFLADLLEVADDPPSAYAYCQQGVNWIQAEMSKPEEEWDLKELVPLMGSVSNQLKILGHLDDALSMIDAAVALVDIHKLGQKQWVVQNLRLADVYRYRREFEPAEKLFLKILEACEKDSGIQDHKHFALQHLGKLYFDQGADDRALECFESALKIRQQEGVPELIASTELAIKTTRARSGS